jgi:hypothetical protein
VNSTIQESGQADDFSDSIPGEIIEEIVDTVLELPGQVVITLHLIALHLIAMHLHQHLVNPRLVVL